EVFACLPRTSHTVSVADQETKTDTVSASNEFLAAALVFATDRAVPGTNGGKDRSCRGRGNRRANGDDLQSPFGKQRGRGIPVTAIARSVGRGECQPEQSPGDLGRRSEFECGRRQSFGSP